jgi:hypothetical protein
VEALVKQAGEAGKTTDVHMVNFRPTQQVGLLATLGDRPGGPGSERAYRLVVHGREKLDYRAFLEKEVRAGDFAGVEPVASKDGKSFTLTSEKAGLSVRIETTSRVPEGRIQRFLKWFKDLVNGFFNTDRDKTVNQLDLYLKEQLKEQRRLLEKDGVTLPGVRRKIRSTKSDHYILGRKDSDHGTARDPKA